MKTKTRHPAHPRRTPTLPRAPRPADPLQRAAAERRLYTDFLALAFYPGMHPETPRARSHAA